MLRPNHAEFKKWITRVLLYCCNCLSLCDKYIFIPQWLPDLMLHDIHTNFYKAISSFIIYWKLTVNIYLLIYGLFQAV